MGTGGRQGPPALRSGPDVGPESQSQAAQEVGDGGHSVLASL
jgi:hypothetical protein